MKRNSYFLILFFNFLCSASDTAFTVYQKQDFDTALVLYAQKERKSSADWYMMGNAAFYKEDYLKATVFWHQSAIQGTFFYAKDVLENINRVREKLHFDELKELPLLYPFQMNSVTAILDWNFFLFFFLLSFVWAFLWIFIFYYRFGIPFIRFCWFITFIIGTLFVYQKLSSPHQGYSGIIVSKSSVFMRVGPSAQYHTTEQIMPGDLVIIVSQSQDWYKIYYKHSFGWIASGNIMTAYSAAESFVLSEDLE